MVSWFYSFSSLQLKPIFIGKNLTLQHKKYTLNAINIHLTSVKHAESVFLLQLWKIRGKLHFVLKFSLCLIWYWKRSSGFLALLLVGLILSMFKGRVTSAKKIFGNRYLTHHYYPNPLFITIFFLRVTEPLSKKQVGQKTTILCTEREYN